LHWSQFRRASPLLLHWLMSPWTRSWSPPRARARLTSEHTRPRQKVRHYGVSAATKNAGNTGPDRAQMHRNPLPTACGNPGWRFAIHARCTRISCQSTQPI